MDLLKQIFTWWNGQTIGTRVFTARFGQFVGSDEFGNKYYKNKDGSRRWVIYNGYAEGSAVPPGWHGWMHHRAELPPTREAYVAREWEKPHRPNPTGTANAHRPQGSLLRAHPRKVRPDYEAWQPGE